jgi:hypothetical protein
MPSNEEVEKVKEWLRMPTTALVASKLRQASKGALKRYDTIPPEDLVRVQMLREVINNIIPDIIDALLVEDKKHTKWDWRKLFRK